MWATSYYGAPGSGAGRTFLSRNTDVRTTRARHVDPRPGRFVSYWGVYRGFAPYSHEPRAAPDDWPPDDWPMPALPPPVPVGADVGPGSGAFEPPDLWEVFERELAETAPARRRLFGGAERTAGPFRGGDATCCGRDGDDGRRAYGRQRADGYGLWSASTYPGASGGDGPWTAAAGVMRDADGARPARSRAAGRSRSRSPRRSPRRRRSRSRR